MMQEKNAFCKSRLFFAVSMAASGGWLAFNSAPLSGLGYAFLAMVGVMLLLMAWRLAAHTRSSAWILLFAWNLGAGSAIPSGWLEFFGNHWGWAGWTIWAAIAAAPALLFPARLAPLALAGGALITALTPIGMMSPISAAMAFFPGWGWAGAISSIALLALPSIPNKKLFAMSAMLVISAGVALDNTEGRKMLFASAEAWAIETYEGEQPTNAVEWFGRQARLTGRVREGIEQGARLVVTPENSVDAWDAWSEAAWMKAIETAKERQAMLLVGVYRHTEKGASADGHADGHTDGEAGHTWQDGLLDVATGEFYGATVPMPVSMWKPWSKNGHFPFDFSQLTRTIETPSGRAAYLVCFEELLVFPLAAKMTMTEKPDLLIAASNQWFSNSTTAEAQSRSVRLQARMWGVPLMRAVNWPSTASHA